MGRQAGFTLVELLVVLVILGLITAFAVPQVMGYLSSSRIQSAEIQIQRLGGVLDLYRLDVGHYPAEQDGLEALVQRPNGEERWKGPYVTNADSLIDPWQNRYVYKFPGTRGPYDLMSLGADGREGGEDENRDIANWSAKSQASR